MNHDNDKDLRKLLKQNIARAANAELPRDLWPRMLEELSHQPAGVLVHVPWFDWVLAGLAGAALILFPGIIPVLLYHL